MGKLESYRDHIVKMSTDEPRTCLARFYPHVTYKWVGDIGPPPVGKCFSCHSNDCTAECPWHPDNPDKETRIEQTLKSGAEKNITWNNSVDGFSRYMEEQQRKWDKWEKETFQSSEQKEASG